MVGDASELRQRRFDLAAEPVGLLRPLLLAASACLRIVKAGAAGLAVFAHGLLEHGDRAGERADFIIAFAIGDLALDIPGSDRLGNLGDPGKRLRNGAMDDHRPQSCEQHRCHGDAGDQPSRVPDAAVDFVIDRARAFGVELGKLREIGVERLAHAAIGIVVSPLAAGRRVDLGPAAHQFATELLKLPYPSGEYSNNAESSERTDLRHSLTTWPMRSLNTSSPSP